MIRAIPIEIFKFCGGDKERRDMWLELSRQCQYASNRFWQEFVLWHRANKTLEIWREDIAIYKAWKASGEGEKPKSRTHPMPPELSRHLWATIFDESPNLHARSRTLLLNNLMEGAKKRKAAKGSLAGWLAILGARESLPSFRNPVPIPFDRQPKSGQVEFIPPADKTSNWKMRIRIERVPQEGKNATSIMDECDLMTRRRSARNIQAVLQRIASGEYPFKGSRLKFDDGKWFAIVTYESSAPEPQGLDAAKVAVLAPARKGPWLFSVDGKWSYRGGLGSHVTRCRSSILRERLQRSEGYKWAGANRKQDGRARGIAASTKLTDRWNDFAKRYNEEVTTRIVRECVSRGVGVLEYWQPEGGFAATRFLQSTGHLPGRLDSMGWQWFSVKTMLERKCERAGIRFVLVKRAGKAVEEKTSVAWRCERQEFAV